MKSLCTVDLFDMQVDFFGRRYAAVVQWAADASMKYACGDRNKLIDEVTQQTAYHVDEFSAVYILSVSKNANTFLKEGDLKVDSWQLMFQTLAQYAMEADVHTYIKTYEESQEDESDTETGRLLQSS